MIRLDPVVRVSITATPVPVLLALREEMNAGNIDGIDFKSFSSGVDYVGVKDMVRLDPFFRQRQLLVPSIIQAPHHTVSLSTSSQETLKDEEGKNIFLCQGELTQASRADIHIPFTCEKVLKLYADAAQKKWSLLLDITNPRVYATNNVFVKAKMVQRCMKNKYSLDVPVLCVTGSHMRYCLSEQDSWEDSEGTTVCETLTTIEYTALQGAKDEDVTILSDGVTTELFDGPIFVFGFAKMRRGISYRSPRRVTTHVVLQLGTGHSIENAIQTLGRGAFNGRSLLKANGHNHVTVLMTSGDWDMVICHQRYIMEVHKRVTSGEDVEEAMRGARQDLPANTNYLLHTQRRTGQRSKHRPHSFNALHHPSFACVATPAELEEGELEKAQWYAHEDNTECYRVLLICYQLWKQSPTVFFPQDVVDAYNDYFSDSNIFLTYVKRHFQKAIVKDGLVNEHPDESKRSKCYSLNNRTFARLEVFLLKVKELHMSQHTSKANDNCTDSAECPHPVKRIKTEDDSVSTTGYDPTAISLDF